MNLVLLKIPANTTHPDHFPPSPEQCVFLPPRNLPLQPQARVIFLLARSNTKSVSFTLAPEAGPRRVAFLLPPSRCVQASSGAARPAQPSPAPQQQELPTARQPLCVCVAAAPAAQGLVPTQLCLQSSVFLQEAAHLPLPPLASCELLTSFPLLPFQGSREPFPLLLGYRSQCDYNPLFPFVPRPFGAVCSFLPLTPSFSRPPSPQSLPSQPELGLLLLLLFWGVPSPWLGSAPEVQQQPPWHLLIYCGPLSRQRAGSLQLLVAAFFSVANIPDASFLQGSTTTEISLNPRAQKRMALISILVGHRS